MRETETMLITGATSKIVRIDYRSKVYPEVKNSSFYVVENEAFVKGLNSNYYYPTWRKTVDSLAKLSAKKLFRKWNKNQIIENVEVVK